MKPNDTDSEDRSPGKLHRRIRSRTRRLRRFFVESGSRKSPLPGSGHDGHESTHDSGQAIVETAISLVVTITLAFWLFELSMMTYTCIVLNDAVHEGVRYATLHGTDSTTCSGPDAACPDHSPYTSVQTAVRGVTAISLHNLTGMNIIVTYPDLTAKPGNRVLVTIEYTYAPYINFPGLRTFLRFNSLGRITY